MRKLPSFQLSARAALAAGVAVGVARLLQLSYPLYAMIATVIVTDLSPAQTRKLGVSRLIGTLLGAFIGGGLGYFFQSGALLIGSGIFAAMLLSHLLNLSHAARVAGYVCGIVLLDHGGQPWSYAFYRTVETVLGIAVAVVVSLIPKLIKARGEDRRDSDS